MILRKTFEGDFKKIDLTWGTAESEGKDRNSWRKRNGCIIPNALQWIDATKEKEEID